MGKDFHETLELLTKKEVLTTREAAIYLGVSPKYIYQLMMRRKVPHYKSPAGRLC